MMDSSVLAQAAKAQAEDHGEDDEGGNPPPPPTPCHTDVRATRNAGNILDSLLDICLENKEVKDGTTVPRPGGSMPSAARTMIELKAIEKMRNEMNVLDPVPARGGGSGSGSAGPAKGEAPGGGGNGGSVSPAKGLPSALEQAMAAFGQETNTLASFERMQQSSGGSGKGGGRKAVLSTQARKRKVAGSEREEAYHDKLSGKMVKSSKRKERMERLRRMY